MGFPQKSSSHRTRTIGRAEKETTVERGPRPTIVVSRDDLCLMTPSSLSSGISRRQQPRDLSQERDRWFESGSLQRRVQTIGSSAVASERKLVGLIPLRLLRGLNDVGGRSSLGRQQGRSAPAALDRPILYLFLAKRAALHLRLFPQAISPGCNVVSLIIRYLSRHSPDFGPLP